NPRSSSAESANHKHDDPPNPGRKIVHGRRVSPARTEAMLRSRWLMRCEHAVANVAPGISRSARVHSHGAATLAGSGRVGSFPVEALPPGAATTDDEAAARSGGPAGKPT